MSNKIIKNQTALQCKAVLFQSSMMINYKLSYYIIIFTSLNFNIFLFIGAYLTNNNIIRQIYIVMFFKIYLSRHIIFPPILFEEAIDILI